MNDLPPGGGNDIDDLYRREASRDSSRPSEAVRRAVLLHAGRIAAERSSAHRSAESGVDRPRARSLRWGPALYGGLAAATLAGLLIAPRFLKVGPAPAAAPALMAESAPRQAAAAREPAVSPMSAGPIDAAPMPSPAAGEAALRAAAQAAQARRPAELAAQLRANSDAELRELGDSGAALRRAAASGDMPRLRTLLGGPISIDARDSNGRTALMLATLHGQQQAVDALLAVGADPNLADSSGTTPLQAAIGADRSSIAAALRRAGAR